MSNTNTGGPAFPSGLIDPSTPEDAVQSLYKGMTLRDYFAAKAMQGELSSVTNMLDGGFGLPTDISDEQLDGLARHWFRIGSAMLKARDA